MTTRRATVLLLLILAAFRAAAQDARPGTTFIPVPYAFYTPETSLAGGVILMVVHVPEPVNTDARENVYRGGGFVTLKGQAEVFASVDYHTPGSGMRVTAVGYAARFPNKFFGIGPDASSEEDYVPIECSIDGTLGFPLTSGFFLGPRLRLFGSWMQQRAAAGALVRGTVAGSDGTALAAPGLRLTWDTRDSAVAPTNGAFVDLCGSWSFVTFGGASYPSATLDARAFVSPIPAMIAGRRIVLAAQLTAAWAGGAPPVQELPRLGGDELLRGYYDGRYRDNALLAAQLEIRLPVWWRFGVAVFGSAGQVARDPLSFRLDTTKLSGGAGLRFVLDETSGASLRVDVAVGSAGADFYLNLGEAF
ncbi:MAG TPA: BamA/TamA family outer membrane protein [Spirochaetia bacterium]|nr:BamA/TamA family outer membrane protein [Spirochaetia bacterium]